MASSFSVRFTFEKSVSVTGFESESFCCIAISPDVSVDIILDFSIRGWVAGSKIDVAWFNPKF